MQFIRVFSEIEKRNFCKLFQHTHSKYTNHLSLMAVVMGITNHPNKHPGISYFYHSLMNEHHEKYINLCFELARKATGSVSPNPLVGAVIVKDGRIVSQGFHSKYGQPHAEAEAINNAKTDLKGAAIYCNLEPCCHTNKQTPPCVPRIIESGISKVIISNTDPNPDVAGKGIQQLKDAGIEVISGVLEDEGRELNKFFFKYIQTGLPYVTVKIAQSIDAMITAHEGEQTWLTGEESRKYVHALRASYDAVLVGANTIKVDDPHLTVRLIDGRNPKRIIIDGNLSSPSESVIFNDSFKTLTTVFTKKNAGKDKISALKGKGVEIIELNETANGQLDLNEILKILGALKVTSILVEGGAKIFKQFTSNNLFDELVILKAPILLKDGLSSQVDMENLNLQLISTEKLGKDAKLVYKRLN